MSINFSDLYQGKNMSKLISLFLLSVLFIGSSASAQFTNGQAADLVLGQPDFVTMDSLTEANKMSGPYGIAFHPSSCNLYVSDYGNSRVLRFPEMLSTGMNAQGVIGQSNFINSATGVSSNLLDFTSGVSVDHDGNLWVADYNNARVLMFPSVDSLANGASATLVLGQSNFTNTGAGLSASSFYTSIEDIYVDSTGRLWVADYNNERVLWFDNAANLANGAAASGVLGKLNFTTEGAGLSDKLMAGPSGVFVDKDDNLWVADFSNDRVLRFANASTLTSGASATAVLGQADFTSSLTGPTQTVMNGPNRLTVDSMGTLWVAEYTGNRVLGYYNAASLSNGAPADVVLGQSDFTSNASATSASGLFTPSDIEVDAQGRLLVVDYGNSRVVRYGHPAANLNASIKYKRKQKGLNKVNATGRGQLLKTALKEGQVRAKFSFFVTNESTMNSDAFRIKAGRYNKRVIRFRYFYKGKNITNKITRKGFLLKNVNPGETVKINARAVVKSSDDFSVRIKYSTVSTIAVGSGFTGAPEGFADKVKLRVEK